MKQEQKNRVILAIWLAVKLLVTARYFYDTFTVALGEGTPLGIAILDGVLIDGVFAALWIVVSFGGQGKTMLAVRPFAAGGAWLLYGLMLRVAQTNGSVALLARYAGGLGLAYDTLDILVAWGERLRAFAGERLRQRRARRSALTFAERQAQMRAKAWRGAYGLALLLLRPVVWIASGVLVLGDLYTDARAAWQPSRRTPANAAGLRAGSQASTGPSSAGSETALRYEQIASGDWVACCDACHWRSRPAASRATASRAYSAHTRGKAHRNATQAIANVDAQH